MLSLSRNHKKARIYSHFLEKNMYMEEKMGSLMAVSSWGDVVKKIEDAKTPLASNWSWLFTLMDTLSVILWVCLALVGAAGGIYCLYVGIKMARADSADQRDENKKRMINIIVTIVVVILLIVVINVFLPMILDAFNVFDPISQTTDDGTGQTT